MIGLLAIVKKAATWGYKRYGLLGGIATGVVAIVGYVAARKAMRRAMESQSETREPVPAAV